MIDRWKIFEAEHGRKVRISEAEWYRRLSADERAAIVEDLYATARLRIVPRPAATSVAATSRPWMP